MLHNPVSMPTLSRRPRVAVLYHYFYPDAPRMLVAVIAPVTVALGILMISRVPYPSFKSIDFYHRAPLAVTAGVMVVLMVPSSRCLVPTIAWLAERKPRIAVCHDPV